MGIGFLEEYAPLLIFEFYVRDANEIDGRFGPNIRHAPRITELDRRRPFHPRAFHSREPLSRGQ